MDILLENNFDLIKLKIYFYLKIYTKQLENYK